MPAHSNNADGNDIGGDGSKSKLGLTQNGLNFCR
jgi:hypothetical protein